MKAQEYQPIPYQRLWGEVEKAKKAGKPQTAVDYLKQIEEKAIKDGNLLEQLVVSEEIVSQMRRYNWKEANNYYPQYLNLRDSIYSDIEGNITKYANNPRVILLLYERLLSHKSEVDRDRKPTGADYLRIKEEALALAKKSVMPEYTAKIEELVKKMDRQELNPSGRDVIMPQKEFAVEVFAKNVKSLKVDIYRLKDNYFFNGDANDVKVTELSKYSKLYSSQMFDTFKNEYNISEKQIIKVDLSKEGVYVLLFDAGERKVTATINASRVAVATRTVKGKTEFYAADIESGEPLSNPRVSIFQDDKIRAKGGSFEQYRSRSTTSYNTEGFTQIDPNTIPNPNGKTSYHFRVENGKDIYAPLMDVNDYEYRQRKEISLTEGIIFTDRELYKPTDEICFKVICYKTDRIKGEVLPNKKITIILRNSDYENIDSLTLVTNEMGSASGRFKLPQDCKNGVYELSEESGVCSRKRVRVETYKRPTFAVTLDRVKEVYCFDDVIKQKGQVANYAGFSVANATIEYEISSYADQFKGKVLSDNDGKFEITFVARRPQEEPEGNFAKNNISVTYSIRVKATDPQGETHETFSTIMVSDTPIDLNIDFGADEEVDNKTDDQGRMLILKEKTKLFNVLATSLSGAPFDIDGTYLIMQGDKEWASGSFSANKQIAFDCALLPSGEYEFEAKIEFRGKTIETKRKVIVFGAEDKVVAVDTSIFCYQLKKTNAIEFLVGTTQEDLYLEMELFSGEERLLREPLHLKNEMRRIVLPYEKSYPSMVVLSLYGFRDGVPIQQQLDFTRPKDVSLDIEIESFRDKTTPRSEECFIVKAPISELMVSIFDITTDRFGAHNFNFTPIPAIDYVGMPNINSSLSEYDFDFRYYKRTYLSDVAYSINSAPTLMKSAGVSADLELNDAAIEEETISELSGAVTDNGEEVVTRSDFGELLVFVPQIKVDESGKAEVRFTTNDNLSTYRVLVMGYDAKLRSGQVEKSLIVQKEVMMVPNIPLFVREGDKIILKSKVVNLGERMLDGVAKIEFSDAITGKIVTLSGTEEIKLKLLAQSQSEVSWEISVPSDIEKLRVKMTFKAEGVSDGEQHDIIVEPNRITLTDAAAFILGQSRGRNYYQKQLLKQIGKVDSIESIEYEEYSTLSAVKEATPIVKKPDSDNTIAWLTAFYINQMRGKVLGADSSKEEADRREAFRDEAIAKINTLQNSDGGLQWFSGMSSSDWITLFFLEKMAQLRAVGAIDYTSAENKLIAGAISYIDSKIAATKDVSFGMVHYFAVRSKYLNVPLSKKADAAFQSYLSKTAEGWQDISILSKALLCETLLNCKGTTYWNKSLEGRVKMLTESLKDYSVENATVGCYFPNAVMPFRGLMNSELYAHAHLLDLFKKLGEKKMVDGLAQWLLLQKHNQAWENTVATTDAIYALMVSDAKDLKFGAVYCTYSTTLDKVKQSGKELKVEREFIRASNDKVIEEGESLSVGDEIIVRYNIYNNENRSFVQMRAMRPACFYPLNEKSGYTWWSRYYREMKESVTNYYFELLPEENTTIEERFYVTQEGIFTTSLVEIESLYAHEYRGHTASMTINTQQ